MIAELDDTDSYEFVKHLTDVHRLHLFDIVMQYRAIFFDSSVQVGRWVSVVYLAGGGWGKGVLVFVVCEAGMLVTSSP